MKEDQNVEFKAKWQDEYIRIIAAFANSEGGKLYIGIDDRGNIIGIDNAKKLLEDIPNKIKNRLGLSPMVRLLKEQGKEYIEIEISPASFAVSYEGKFYTRSGSTTQELEGQNLLNFLLEKSGKTWDELFEEEATLDDIDVEWVMKFKELAGDKYEYIKQESNWITILEKLRLVENGKVKRAAILLFGKDPQKFYLQSAVKIGKFLKEGDILSSDIVEGNLFQQLQKTLEVLQLKYLIKEIRFEGLLRREVLEYPYEALREAITNALIHRDYLGTSNVQIRIYQDRLMIMNEGRFPPGITPETLKTVHISKPRNPLLASVFYYAGFIEKWGSGTLKIISACKEQGLPEPDFIEEEGVIRVVLYKDIYTEENLRKMGLNERQIKAVMYVKEKGKITNREYQKINKVSNKTAYLELNTLVELKIMKKEGTGRNLVYKVMKK